MASNPLVHEPHSPLIAQDPVLPGVQQAAPLQQEAPPVLQQNPGAQPQAAAAVVDRFADVPGRPANVRHLRNINSPETRFLRAMHRTLKKSNGKSNPRNIVQVRYVHPETGNAIHIYARSAGPNNPAVTVNNGEQNVQSRCSEGFLTLAQQQGLAGVDLNGYVKQHVSSTNSPCNLCHQNNL